jgi:hypothetical protein
MPSFNSSKAIKRTAESAKFPAPTAKKGRSSKSVIKNNADIRNFFSKSKGDEDDTAKSTRSPVPAAKRTSLEKNLDTDDNADEVQFVGEGKVNAAIDEDEDAGENERDWVLEPDYNVYGDDELLDDQQFEAIAPELHQRVRKTHSTLSTSHSNKALLGSKQACSHPKQASR